MSRYKGLLSQPILFWGSVACMVLLSASFLFMPFASEMSMQGNPVPIRLSGIWLWATLIIGYVLLFLVNHRRRKALLDNRKTIPKRKPGVIRIFSNQWATIADGAFVVSLIGLLVTVLVNSQSYLASVFLCAAVLTFQMHCILNGENFRYILKLTKTKQEGI